MAGLGGALGTAYQSPYKWTGGMGTAHTGGAGGAYRNVGLSGPTTTPYPQPYPQSRGAGSPAAQPAPMPTPQYPMPAPQSQPQMPYQPGAPRAAKIAGQMGEYGAGLLNPNSPEARRMQEVLTGRIGEETEAAKRLAAFQASQAGMGGGESPELMAMLSDIDIEGMEAGGRASAEMMTQLPGMGLGFMQGGLQGELGISGQDLSAFLAQQQLQQRSQEAGMESFYRGRGLDLEQQRINNQAEMNRFAQMFG